MIRQFTRSTPARSQLAQALELLDDYEDFCEAAGILASSDADMLVVGCSQSLPDNLELRLYYDSKKPGIPAKYIGFYQGKAVRAVGALRCVVQADLHGEALTTNGPAITDDERNRIREAIQRAPRYGWNIEHGCSFFLAENVEETKFRKTTKYALWSRRYFDLREVLKLESKAKLPDVKTLAERLREVTW